MNDLVPANGKETRLADRRAARKRENTIQIADKTLGINQIKRAFRESDGNPILAAARLCVGISQLDNALQMGKPALATLLGELIHYNPPEKYLGIGLERVKKDIERRQMLYRSEALDAIHDLAMMPIQADSPAMMQVKLLAANRLYLETGDAKMGTTIDDTLRALNQEFHATAKRISVIRETVREVHYEEQPAEIDVTTATS